jgi:hypothetical protein
MSFNSMDLESVDGSWCVDEAKNLTILSARSKRLIRSRNRCLSERRELSRRTIAEQLQIAAAGFDARVKGMTASR